MRLSEITVGVSKNIGNYNNVKVEQKYILEEGDDIGAATDTIAQLINEQIDKLKQEVIYGNGQASKQN